MADKKIVIRPAEPKDNVNIFKLLMKGWNEQVVEYAPVDDLRGYLWILRIIEEGFLAVADLSGRIVGAACAQPFRPPWSREWMADMEFLYIDPKFRADGLHRELLRAVESWADKVNLTVIFGIQTGEQVDTKDRLMKIAGFTYVGGNFLRPASGQIEEHVDNDTEE